MVGNDIYRTFCVIFFFELLFLYDLIWYVSDVYTDVLWALQWCHEVTVGYIGCHEPGYFCTDDAVEDDFCDTHIFRGCGYFTWVVYFVSAYGESHSVLIFLLGSYTAHKFPVC